MKTRRRMTGKPGVGTSQEIGIQEGVVQATRIFLGISLVISAISIGTTFLLPTPKPPTHLVVSTSFDANGCIEPRNTVPSADPVFASYTPSAWDSSEQPLTTAGAPLNAANCNSGNNCKILNTCSASSLARYNLVISDPANPNYVDLSSCNLTITTPNVTIFGDGVNLSSSISGNTVLPTTGAVLNAAGNSLGYVKIDHVNNVTLYKLRLGKVFLNGGTSGVGANNHIRCNEFNGDISTSDDVRMLDIYHMSDSLVEQNYFHQKTDPPTSGFSYIRLGNTVNSGSNNQGTKLRGNYLIQKDYIEGYNGALISFHGSDPPNPEPDVLMEYNHIEWLNIPDSGEPRMLLMYAVANSKFMNNFFKLVSATTSRTVQLMAFRMRDDSHNNLFENNEIRGYKMTQAFEVSKGGCQGPHGNVFRKNRVYASFAGTSDPAGINFYQTGPHIFDPGQADNCTDTAGAPNTVVGNVVYVQSGGEAIRTNVLGSHAVNIYNNTLITPTGIGIQQDSSGTVDFRNNRELSLTGLPTTDPLVVDANGNFVLDPDGTYFRNSSGTLCPTPGNPNRSCVDLGVVVSGVQCPAKDTVGAAPLRYPNAFSSYPYPYFDVPTAGTNTGCLAWTGNNPDYGAFEFSTGSCVENWSCSAWSACSGGTQTRTCTDLNACGTTVSRPPLSQSCTTGDTTPPTVAITAPTNGSMVSGNVTVTANAADNVGVAGVQFMLDGIGMGSEDTVAPYSQLWPTTYFPGSHILSASVRDTAGNSTTSAGVTVTVSGGSSDTTLPIVTLTSPANRATISGTSVTVSASASDNVGVVGVQFKLNGINLQAEDTTAPYAITWNTTTLNNATYTLTAVARDAAGNQGESNFFVTVSNPLVPCTPEPLPLDLRQGSGTVGLVKCTSITLSLASAGAATMTLVAFDIDAPAEAIMWINGHQVALPPDAYSNDVNAYPQPFNIPLEYLLNGSNEIRFKFADNLSGTTGGFQILSGTTITINQLSGGGGKRTKKAV